MTPPENSALQYSIYSTRIAIRAQDKSLHPLLSLLLLANKENLA
jgi:hypothetical protein